MRKYNENFIDIRLSPSTVYVFSVRKLLQKAIDKNLVSFRGVLLDLGCGEMPYKQYILDNNKSVTKYIGADVDFSSYHRSVRPDLLWDGKKLNLADGSVDTVMATELFEHVKNLEEVLGEVHRVLKPGGTVFFTVPFVWPLHETPNDECRYTPYSLERALNKVDFNSIEIVPLGGYNAALAQMICIWIFNRQNELSSLLGKFLFSLVEKHILYPVIIRLLKKDHRLNIDSYGENTMPTGFYGHAKK